MSLQVRIFRYERTQKKIESRRPNSSGEVKRTNIIMLTDVLDFSGQSRSTSRNGLRCMYRLSVMPKHVSSFLRTDSVVCSFMLRTINVCSLLPLSTLPILG